MFVTRDGAHVVLPFRLDIAALIPHAKPFDFGGRRMMLLPNRSDEAKLCRNLGVPVPPPILTRYDWPHGQQRTPWEAQKATAALMTENSRAYVLNDMGTGKTTAALWGMDYLLRFGGARRFLVTAPLSTLDEVWLQECFRTLPGRTAKVLYGDRMKRHKLLAEDADFYIINHHGLAVMLEALIARGFDGIVVDEGAVFRRKGTSLWKNLNQLVNAPTTRWAWWLTGKPTPNGPVDAWAQVRLLTPNRVPRTEKAFRELTMRQVSLFKWEPKPNANEIVHQAMQPAVRFTRDDVVEIPDTTYVDRKVVMSDKAKLAFKALNDKMFALAGARGITAANEGVLHNKLMQVGLGLVYTDDRTVYDLGAGDRLTVLEELLGETPNKTIVFVPYVHALEAVRAHVEQAGYTVGVVHGGTAQGVRSRIFGAFQREAEPQVLVAHPQCMAHGLTLTAADTIVWYGPSTSLEIYEQANARITRPGQRHKTLIAHLVGTPVEKATYSRLRNRAKMQGILLDIFGAQTASAT